jgi:hypothetical protein
VDTLAQTLSKHSFNFFLIMSAELMIAALRRGKNGNEILAILDAVTGEDKMPATENAGSQPTLEPIEF